MMKRNKIILATIFIFLFVSGYSQGWECEDCPKRNVGLFDLDVWIEDPLVEDPSAMGQKLHQTWVELFMVAGGVHNTLFNDDPSKECINYYDGQMAMLSGLDEQNYQHGNNQTSLPPAAGIMDEVDYWITGVIANQESDGLTIIKVYVQASGTGETVAEAVYMFDGTLSGFEAGKKIAQQLLPLMGKIRDFEKRKRDEEDKVAIGPYEGATLTLTPAKREIEPGDKTKVKIKLLDCDDVPLRNMEIKLTSEITIVSRGGYFNPKIVTTNEAGEATSVFTAKDKPGRYPQPFEFEFRYPFSFKNYSAGDEGYINIVPLDIDAQITITKNHRRILQTSMTDGKREHVEKHRIDETMNASANIYLQLTNTMDMPILNQTWHYYQPIQVSINSFENYYKENKHITDPDYVTNIDIVRINKTHKIEGEEYISQFPPWMLVIDNESQKAVKLIPAGYGIEYEFIETEKSVTTSSSKKDSNTETRHRKKSFKLGPVGEKGPDPTVKKSDTWIQDYLKRQGIELPPGAPIPNISNEDAVEEIQPDVLVKQGDGITSFGGGANRMIDNKLEDGFETINLNYNWSMSVKKKE